MAEVTINEDALKGHIAETVKATISGMAQEAQAREAQARQEAAARAAAQKQDQTLWEDPVAKTVLGNPGVQKVMGDVAFTAQNAMDHTQFYGANPEALARSQEIERIALGSRINRESAYAYVLGVDAKRALDTARATRAAAGEINAGPGGLGRPDQSVLTVEKMATMSLDDQRRALHNASF